MCGIFGITIPPDSIFPKQDILTTLKKVSLLSESRGKDSSGIAFFSEPPKSFEVVKGDIPLSSLLKSKIFATRIGHAVEGFGPGKIFSAIGHARLVTNGSQLQECNNQPVIKDDMVVIHNGIVVNVDELWQKNSFLNREYQIDTEIIPTILGFYMKEGKTLAQACNATLKQIFGTYSIALMFSSSNDLALATNTGSLYFMTDQKNLFVFASERYFLKQLLLEKELIPFAAGLQCRQILPGNGLIINLSTLQISTLVDPKTDHIDPSSRERNPVSIQKHILKNQDKCSEVVIDPSIYRNRYRERHLINLPEDHVEEIRALQRCSKCLLPKTFPFIEYDDHGVCNYCRNYQRRSRKVSMEYLKILIKPYRRSNGAYDCLVPFSGGRDSTFTLHYVKRELSLNPIAFTYDWGMVNDLSRRNAARVCGKLGIENIIVAADIRKKRQNIRKNLEAWLRRPHLGMVPLFMAGDKYFFYYSNKILEQNGIRLSIWGSNPLENTDFKIGFTGLKPEFNKRRIDQINFFKKIGLLKFFGEQYLKNLKYFNRSLFDTFGSFLSRYMVKRDGYIQLFDYVKWDEKVIEDLILNEYKWEKSKDTETTWRIGDGTAAFYNYIYYTIAGFSEYDTFRSNQIREGVLSREEGLLMVEKENQPRCESLRWYLDIIGMDFADTIKRINNIPKLYLH